MQERAPPSVDVVVPTFRRPDRLARCMEALGRQTVAPASIQVVDDSATDKGPAWARNVGWRRGRAAVVAFTDDDCVPRPDWVERIQARFKRPGLEALEGAMVTLDAQGREVAMDPPRRARWDRFRTSNMAYARSLLERLEGFDERYHIHREDTDLAWRALRAGATIPFAPEVVVAHPDRPGVARDRPESELRLYRADPRRYAEVAAAAVHVASWRDGRLANLRRQLRTTRVADLRPLSRSESVRLWTRASLISLQWRIRARR